MAMFVHVTSARVARNILRTGLRGPVFCMPVLPNFMVTHQWVRELRRSADMHPRAVGVYFRLAAAEEVWAGHYLGRGGRMAAGQAAGFVMRNEQPLGLQVVLERSLSRREVHAVRPLPAVGWRYHPGAHFRPVTCACRYCLPKGGIKTRRLRNRLDPEGRSY